MSNPSLSADVLAAPTRRDRENSLLVFLPADPENTSCNPNGVKEKPEGVWSAIGPKAPLERPQSSDPATA